MKDVTAIYINEKDIVDRANELARIENRRTADSIKRLLRKSLRAKLSRMKRKK